MNPTNSDSPFSACEQCLMRQFDADVQHTASLPDDVQAHLQHCASCRQEWADSQHFDQQLQQQLREQPSTSLYRKSYLSLMRFAEERQRKYRLWFSALQWLAIGLVTMSLMVFSLQYLPDAATFEWVTYCCAALVTGFGFAYEQTAAPGEEDLPNLPMAS